MMNIPTEIPSFKLSENHNFPSELWQMNFGPVLVIAWDVFIRLLKGKSLAGGMAS